MLPVCTLTRRSVVKDAAQVAELCAQRKVTAVVVGLPYELDGTETRSARLARQVGDAVGASGMPVHYQDERFTTVEAIERLGAAGVYGTQRKAAVMYDENFINGLPGDSQYLRLRCVRETPGN